MRKSRSKYICETVVFNGVVYRRYPDSPNQSDRRYFRCSSVHFKKGLRYLHRDIWTFHNGAIPEGFHVHHKDDNSSNNDLFNLVLRRGFKHLSEHAKQTIQEDPERNRAQLKSVQELAAEWHRSEDGRKWHSQHAKRVFENREPIEKVCEICQSIFQTKDRKSNIRFCSNACKSKSRVNSGIDNVSRTCIFCGTTFEINKYSRTQCCSESCAAKYRWQKRKNRTGL